MSDWQETVLGNLCQFVGGHGFPPEHQGLPTGDVPFIKVSDMELDGNERRITTANNWLAEATVMAKRFKPQPSGAVVFAKIGEAIKRERVRMLTRPTIVDNNMMAAVPTKSVHPDFLLNLLRYIPFSKDHGGTSLPYLRQSDLAKIVVRIPPLEEQERIAGVLGAFDDLIETNRRLSGDLLARLFAEYEVLGRGQPSTTFGTVARLVRDQWKPGSEGPHRYLGLEHFATEGGGLIGHGSSSAVQSVSLRFARGDVLYGKLRPYFRKVARPGFDGLCSSEVWVLRAQEGYPQSLVHALAHSPRFSEVAMAGSGGTRMPRADWKQVSALPVPDLGSATMSQAELRGLEALWFAACELDVESKDLARQRDELLPLLMSGKVRVRDVEVAAS